MKLLSFKPKIVCDIPMRYLAFQIYCAMLAFFLTTVASFALPPCSGNNVKYWDNCSGTIIHSGGNKYVGEWRNGKAHGYGTFSLARDTCWKNLCYPAGGKYVGEFKNDLVNGYGIATYPSGKVQEGYFKNNKFMYSAPIRLKPAFYKLSKSERLLVQTNLSKEGFYTSSIDGLYGPNTQKAFSAYNNRYLRGASLKNESNIRNLLNAVLNRNSGISKPNNPFLNLPKEPEQPNPFLNLTPAGNVKNTVMNFIAFGGWSSIIAFSMMFAGLWVITDFSTIRQKSGETIYQLLVYLFAGCAVYTCFTGIVFLGYEANLSSEAQQRLVYRKGGWVINIFLSFWPYICIFFGALTTYIFLDHANKTNNALAIEKVQDMRQTGGLSTEPRAQTLSSTKKGLEERQTSRGPSGVGFGKFIARKGAIGSTARWAASCFMGYFRNYSVGNFNTDEELRREIDKIVYYALKIRFSGDLQHVDAQKILSEYATRRQYGYWGFVISILVVEAGLHRNTQKDISMFGEIVEEELEKANVGPVIIYGRIGASCRH